MRISQTIRDIRFWLFIFFAVRMIGITDPPIEAAHNWRQSFTAMVARNFLERDANILYPRINMTKGRSDIVAAEFPVFNYLIFGTAKVFGYRHWYGRLISLVFCSFGIWFFYLLVKRYFGEPTAFYSALVLLVSIWFAYSRKIMPDAFSVSLVIAGLYFMSRFLDRGGVPNVLLFFLLCTLGGLSKIPGTVLFSLVWIPLLSKEITVSRKLALTCASAAGVAVISWWYFYWQPYLLETYHNQLYFPFTLSEGWKEVASRLGLTLEQFYFHAFYSYAAFAAFLAGLYLVVRKREKLIAAILVSSFAIFFYFILKTGNIFPTHNYYIIPFVPVMALAAGYALASIPAKKLGYAAIAVIGIEALANQFNDLLYNEKRAYKVQLESIADKVCGKDDLVAVSGGEGENPQELYFAHRNGWIITNDKLGDAAYLAQLKGEGCKFIFVDKHEWEGKLQAEKVYEDENVSVYRL